MEIVKLFTLFYVFHNLSTDNVITVEIMLKDIIDPLVKGTLTWNKRKHRVSEFSEI